MDSSTTDHQINQPSTASRWSQLLLLGTALAILAGCSTAHHRKKADEEAYAIIAEVEKHVFGKASDFTIDTRYSHRDPEEILAPEIIEERQTIGAIKVTLPEALKMAAENDRTFQTQRENLYLKALTLSDRRYAAER